MDPLEENGSLKSFADSILNNIHQNFHKAKFEYLNDYDFAELDPLRNEISSCIICGHSQAAITLTNHLLENALKTFLIYSDVLVLYANESISFYDKIRKGIEKYDHLKLNITIDKAFEKGILELQEKDQLHIYRDDFRNAFSHATKKKMYKDDTFEITEIEVIEGEIKSIDKIEDMVNLLPWQGIFQAVYSENKCLEYFQYVDRMIRRALKYLDSLKKDKFAGT
jgi:hypothetical protein